MWSTFAMSRPDARKRRKIVFIVAEQIYIGNKLNFFIKDKCKALIDFFVLSLYFTNQSLCRLI